MKCLVAIVLLASCYSPGYRDCEVLCASGACPSGFECIADVCRDPASVAQTCAEVLGDAGLGGDSADADTDLDDDRVADDVDNCPTVDNTGQYNEDGDMLGDACDPCPIFAGATLTEALADADSDMIGDLCDPNMSSAGDTVIFFDGFNDTPAGVITPGTADTITYSNGKAIAAPAGDRTANAIWSLPALMPGVRPYSLRTRVTLIQLPGLAETSGAGLIDNADIDGHGGACILGNTTNTNPPVGVIAAEALEQSDNAIASRTTTPPVANGVVLPLTMFHPPGGGALNMWFCSADPNAAAPGQQPAGTLSGTYAGIHSRGTQATFDFLYIVDSPAP